MPVKFELTDQTRERGILQVARQIWWDGRVADCPHEGAGRENRRLKKMYAEERLKSEIIREAMAKKW